MHKVNVSIVKTAHRCAHGSPCPVELRIVHVTLPLEQIYKKKHETSYFSLLPIVFRQ